MEFKVPGLIQSVQVHTVGHNGESNHYRYMVRGGTVILKDEMSRDCRIPTEQTFIGWDMAAPEPQSKKLLLMEVA